MAATPQPKTISGSYGGQRHQAPPHRGTAPLGSFRNAWALCVAAPFHNLKPFYNNLAELCLQHFDQDLGLRSSPVRVCRSLRSPPSPSKATAGKAEVASPQGLQSLTTGPRIGSRSLGASSYADATAGGSALIQTAVLACLC